MAKKVFVGLSGGVDSSVSAALLKQQGYDVTGVYMKNWSRDLPGFPCPWERDYQDAKRVAVQLGIPFKLYDFETEYQQKVVDYMLAEYQAGRTPNPDIMCNQEVKFKLFLETALEDGADLIATGHYAVIKNHHLYQAKDQNKDQTYFLYRISPEALAKTIFPIGGYTKPEVRALAKKLGLATAAKKESMGICFVGKVGIKDFLLSELGPQPAGDIVDQQGRKIGRHDGAIFYTIGQRHGLDLGGGLPYYVTGKDMASNQVFVTTDLGDEGLWGKKIKLNDTHWLTPPPQNRQPVKARTRHRAPLIDAVLNKTGKNWDLLLADEVRATTPGQSAVIYDGKKVLGGGIIA